MKVRDELLPAKMFCFVAIVMLIVVVGTGCASKGMVRAEALEKTVHSICERHDKYVEGDAYMPAAEKEDALADCRLLKETITLAKGSGNRDPK